MRATSIEDTGAKPGDRVRCIGTLQTGESWRRFIEGMEYTVVDFCGTPSAHGRAEGGRNSMIPARGWGYEWEKV